MKPVVRRVITSDALDADELKTGSNAEWLVSNGLGGYASGTVFGRTTRRYHGLLIAALPAPLGRIVMLSGLVQEIHFPDGHTVDLNPQREAKENRGSPDFLTEFRLEMGLPAWRYQLGELVIEKRLHLPYRQNSVQVTYQLLACSEKIEISLRPLIQFREHEAPVTSQPDSPYMLTVVDDTYEVSTATLPPLRMFLYGKGEFLVHRTKIERVDYPSEEERGYEATGDLWTPGSFRIKCSMGHEVTLIASTESWETIRAMSPLDAWNAECERRDRLIASAQPKARSGFGAELALAADQFVAIPAGRLVDATRAYALGDEMRTVMAGYHWFTDWGRDTMISLEGLTLTTNRFLEASWILRNFANAIRDGLIPNLFPERSREGLYHTADATLWFFHAIERYLKATEDRWTLRLLLPKLLDVVDHHLRGTRFGIGVDHEDGLLRQGAEGYQLTWMDAKVGDWVVTPRRGKAVEICALWYNALVLMGRWCRDEIGDAEAERMMNLSDRVLDSFNRRFWYEKGGYLYDVVDGEQGDDPSCRPNQVFAISLTHPILDPSKWKPVLETVRKRLLTPVGLRSLAPGHPDYKAKYFGDLRARDAAYHQGTVWAWPIGPFIDAWIKVHPGDFAGAAQFLEGFRPHLRDACVGSI